MDQTAVTYKFICVLNKKLETGKAFNALGHMAVGLTSLYADTTGLRFQKYIDADGGEHKNISDNPFIVLKADNSNQIRNLRNKLTELEIQFTDFTDTMTEGTYLEQHEKTRKTKEAELEYYGICFFCEMEKARELTKKFSLYQ